MVRGGRWPRVWRPPAGGSGVEGVLSVAFAHVVFTGVDPDRVVHDAVEDGVGDHVASQLAVPFLGLQLGGERGAGGVVSAFEQFEQERFEPFVGFVHEPFVDGQERVRGVLPDEFGDAVGLAGGRGDLFGQVGHAHVDGPVSVAACGFRQRAQQVGLARPGRPLEHDVESLVEVAPGVQGRDPAPVEAAFLGKVDGA